MTIVRAGGKSRDFTIISNKICRDSGLSMRALGLLVNLLCRPDNWTTNSDAIARCFGCGRDQVRTAIRELEERGYMILDRWQDERGRWNSRWVVLEDPADAQDAIAGLNGVARQPKTALPTPENPHVGKPGTRSPAAGESGAINDTLLPRTETKINREAITKKDSPREEEQPNGPLSATPSPKARQKKTRSSICPQSFKLDPELRQWCDATAPGVNVDRELQKFMAHEFRTPKSNWNLAFKNWMLRAVEYQGRPL